MNNEREDIEKQITDYKINVQMITFVVVIMVVILTLVYFIRIYSGKKTRVLREMKIEAILLETVISDHLNYSQYFIGLIGKNIRVNPDNLDYIKETLQKHFHSKDFNMLFGWRKYSWIDNHFKELVTSNVGIENKPRTIELVKEVVNKMNPTAKTKKDNTIFRLNKSTEKASSLKLINAIFDQKNNKFIGAVVLSYDLNTMVRSLNNNIKNQSINFVIIDKDLSVVAKSKPEIDNIISKDDIFPSYLLKSLKNLNWEVVEGEEYSYLDMINGVNYHIKPLANLPFAIIVNIDNDFIKNDILENITKKFLEVGFFAGICLIVIISIYRRETSLRTKAEKATIIANNATEAKTSFLAFTAHEIRSPLGFILTGSEVISKELFGPLPEKYLEYVEGIHNNGQVILDFITDILDENQIIEGQFKITNTLNKIQTIISQVAKAHTGKKNIIISTHFAKQLPSLVCDKRRMFQVIDNLVNNSIKYSKENTKITISATMEDDRMILTIVDQGVGMREEEIPIALSKFGTLNKQDYQKGRSYGLGLPIVKMLLDAHDAALEIHSVYGEGTTVRIIFPKYKIVFNNSKAQIGSDETVRKK